MRFHIKHNKKGSTMTDVAPNTQSTTLESGAVVTEAVGSVPVAADPTPAADATTTVTITLDVATGVYTLADGTVVDPTEAIDVILPPPVVEPVTETVTLTVNPDGTYDANNGTVVQGTETVAEVFAALFPTA